MANGSESPASGQTASAAAPEVDLSDWTFAVGTVLIAHGLRGELKVADHHGEPRFFAAGAELCAVDAKGSRRLLTVRNCRGTNRSLIVRTAEVTDRTAAEGLRGSLLAIEHARRGPRSDGSPWDDELLGVQVSLDSGEDVGAITEVLHYPAHDVYATPLLLVPAVPEWVLEFDPQSRRMVIRADDGLFIENSPARRGRAGSNRDPNAI